MHRSISLVGCAALAACSSQPAGNNAVTTAPVANTIAPANAMQSDSTTGTTDSAVTPKPGVLKTFGDWAVGCDNINHCTMASLGPEDGGDFPSINLAVARDAGPTGGLTVTLQPGDTGDAKAGPASIAIDGTPVGGSFPAGDTPSVSGDAAAAIASAMANGHALAIRNKAGASIAGVSLKGASAALRYIDAQQGRAGTATALVAKGDQPASAVPAAPAAPQVIGVVPIGKPVTPPAALVAHMSKQASCDDTGPAGDLETFALGGGSTLVLVPCGAGAYNFSSAVFVMDNGQAAPARIDAPSGFGDGDGGPAVPEVVNADFKNGVLTSYAKGRGLGDCGVLQDFAWDGSRFRLIEQDEMGECRGNPNYIRTWTARLARR